MRISVIKLTVGSMIALASAALAQAEPTSSAVEKSASIYDQIWDYTEWYHNPDNPVIQSFRFTGRFQLDYATVGEDNYDDVAIRRFRLGGNATLFQHVTLHSEVDLQPEASEIYQRLTDAYLAWSRSRE